MAQVRGWRRVRQPIGQMLDVGFVELRPSGSDCRRKMHSEDTLLPGRTQVECSVSTCIGIQSEGEVVKVQ